MFEHRCWCIGFIVLCRFDWNSNWFKIIWKRLWNKRKKFLNTTNSLFWPDNRSGSNHFSLSAQAFPACSLSTLPRQAQQQPSSAGQPLRFPSPAAHSPPLGCGPRRSRPGGPNRQPSGSRLRYLSLLLSTARFALGTTYRQSNRAASAVVLKPPRCF